MKELNKKDNVKKTGKKVATKQKQKIEKVKKEKQQRIEKIKKQKKLRTALLLGFVAPVVLIFALGLISYNLASDAIIDNYEKSSNETLSANAKYMESIFKEISTQSVKLITSKNFEQYYNRKNNDVLVNLEYIRNIKNEAMTNSVLIAGIRNTYILNSTRDTISTGNDRLVDSTYETFRSAVLVEGETQKDGWYGSHAVIDAKEERKYALTYIKEALKGETIVITDVDYSYVQDMLDNIYREGGVTALVAKDGVEIYSTDSKVGEENLFFGKDYYHNIIDEDATSGYTYVTIHGVNNLLSYCEIGDTGLVLVNLMPRSIIVGSATSIGSASAIFAVISAIIALVIGSLLAKGIGKAIGDMKDTMESVAQGDLTVTFKTRRKDEFKVLENSLSNMINNMQQLVTEVAEVSNRVGTSADELSNTSSIVLEASKDIATAVNEVAIGSSKQVLDTDVCLKQMSTLSDMVNKVFDGTNEIDTLFESTKGTVADGLAIVNNLNDKAKATSEITKEISVGMKNLEENSHTIENIVNAINEISEQTNLLSLNASIEAARAGESGRGFAVVAGEIGNLAAKSMESANQIQTIINTIQRQTKDTAKTTQRAEEIVLTQEQALQDTIQVFGSINSLVAGLVVELGKIKDYVAGMEGAKNDTLDSIQNISAVSEEAAAASEEVSATVINQSEEMEQLASAAEELSTGARVLQQAIGKFKI
ncbi:methyl-accepting chemotaxis protein [Anaerosporobacter sp.]|uniref:methyl-accepting chemotaxis protein n=1 Tax=Anaerosporobacter sp. TaxID=1872529 RepID=UPI00286F52E0|nr:methyl-accepting chemotaxis protein [Anaerosporobacter sp.]